MLRKLYRVLAGLFLVLVLVLLLTSAGCKPPAVTGNLPAAVTEPVPAPPSLAPATEPAILAPAPIVLTTPDPPAPVAPALALPEPAPARKMWPGPNEVWIWGGEYRPNKIVVPVGTTVTWTGIDAEEHDVASDDGLFFGNIVQGVSFSYTFAERGSYCFHCNCGCIEGVVVVE